ncbi:MAG: hypothetical protein U9Q98_09385 [Bacteroidota bacterium]|nr:hypothetical protein [Bacteroidota bacterium]
MLLRKPVKYILGFIIGGICVLSAPLQAQNHLPYPVIFVHGLAGSETTFGGTLEYLRDEQNLGPVNVFDIVLNADNNTETALLIMLISTATGTMMIISLASTKVITPTVTILPCLYRTIFVTHGLLPSGLIGQAISLVMVLLPLNVNGCMKMDNLSLQA